MNRANKAVEATAANARLFHIDLMRIHHPTNSDEGLGLVASL